MYSTPSTGKFFGLWLAGPLAEPWLNKLASCSAFCLKDQARRRRVIIIVLSPPPWTMPPLPPLLMTTLAAIGGKGFAACLWVNLRPESAHHQCRIRGSGSARSMMMRATLAHAMAITSRMVAARAGGGQRDKQQ